MGSSQRLAVGLQDGLFSAASASAGGENADARPSHFEWDRTGNQPIVFYTDYCMPNALADKPSKIKVAWIRESYPYAKCWYDWAAQHEDAFDYVLTYHRGYLEAHDPRKWLFCPYGGSFIQPRLWRVWGKSKNVSMFASFKDDTEGHKLRHAIKARFAGQMDVLGTINGPSQIRKFDAVAPYRYSIIVHAERLDWGFSDHIIDAFALGTIPIHWGCPDIGRFFERDGILPFETLDELARILPGLSEEDYYRRRGAVERNLRRAERYAVVEDWLYQSYPFLFEGAK